MAVDQITTIKLRILHEQVKAVLVVAAEGGTAIESMELLVHQIQVVAVAAVTGRLHLEALAAPVWSSFATWDHLAQPTRADLRSLMALVQRLDTSYTPLIPAAP